MKRIALSILIATLSLTGLVSAHAQDVQSNMGKRHKMPVFSDCDLNGDGVIVADEFIEARSRRMAERAAAGRKMKNAANAPSFESIDTDDDGEISTTEFDVHKAEMMEKRQQRKQKG